VQHKKKLGIKHISRVRFLKGAPYGKDNRVLPQILFDVNDVPAFRLLPDPIGPLAPSTPEVAIPRPDSEAPPRNEVRLAPLPHPFADSTPSPQLVIPGPSTLDPVISGLSTPRPIQPRSPPRLARQDAAPRIAHQVRHEMKDEEFLREHIFLLV
jgi:hypothetical protein